MNREDGLRVEGRKFSKMISMQVAKIAGCIVSMCLKSSSIFGVGLTCPANSLGSVGLTGVLGHEFLCFASCLVVVLQYPLGLSVGNWS